MEGTISRSTNRRHFLTKVIPGCAVACLGAKNAFSRIASERQQDDAQIKHKFDEDFRMLTYRQLSELNTRSVVDLVRALEKEMGKEKVNAFLRNFSTEQLLMRGKMQAAQTSEHDLQSYVAQFKQNELFKKALTVDIVEDNDRAFEMKVTECLTASTFLAKEAGDIGYALVCWGDYAWAEGYNPKIKLVRDKTLMEGHAYCNHRYVWTG